MAETLFLVFAFDSYYPAGGWEDFKAAFATREEADAYVERLRGSHDWVQVIDLAQELGAMLEPKGPSDDEIAAAIASIKGTA